MLDSSLRPMIDLPLNFMGKKLANLGITANQVTLCGFFLGLVANHCIATNAAYPWGLGFLLLNRLCDGLDGAVARHSTLTDFGGFLDIVCDFFFYSGVPLAFALTALSSYGARTKAEEVCYLTGETKAASSSPSGNYINSVVDAACLNSFLPLKYTAVESSDPSFLMEMFKRRAGLIDQLHNAGNKNSLGTMSGLVVAMFVWIMSFFTSDSTSKIPVSVLFGGPGTPATATVDSLALTHYVFPATFLIFSFVGPISSFLAYAILAAKRGVPPTTERGRKSFYYLGGLCEGTETFACLALMCVMPELFREICYTYGIMCGITTLGRVYIAWIEFDCAPTEGSRSQIKQQHRSLREKEKTADSTSPTSKKRLLSSTDRKLE